MMAVDKIRGRIVEKGYSQKRLADELGITPKTFYTKMKKGVFNLNEIEAMMDILDIDDPRDYFFTHDVAQ